MVEFYLPKVAVASSNLVSRLLSYKNLLNSDTKKQFLGQVLELVDNTNSKFVELCSWEFKSLLGHKIIWEFKSLLRYHFHDLNIILLIKGYSFSGKIRDCRSLDRGSIPLYPANLWPVRLVERIYGFQP